MSTELLPLEGSKSAVWNHFGFPAKDGKFVEPDKRKQNFVVCKLCGKHVKYNGNTTNLRVHLHDTHRQVFDALLRSEKHTVSAKPPANTLAEAFKRGEVIPRTWARWNQITDAVCFFIARDMQPFDTVNDPGFQHFYAN